MPVMDGVELTRKIKEQHPRLPVMLLSSLGNDLPADQQALFSSVLTKPVKQNAARRMYIIFKTGCSLKNAETLFIRFYSGPRFVSQMYIFLVLLRCNNH